LEEELHEQKRLYEQHPFRRSSGDSGFGSVEDSDEALERMKAMHAKDRMSTLIRDDADEELDSQLSTLKSKIGLLESQLQHERERTRNVEEERDEAVKRLAAALNETEGLKSENKALKGQIAQLKNQFEDSLKISASKISVKDRIKERVETERKKEIPTKKKLEHREADRSFIDVVIACSVLILGG
jgi:chromosome segregation ATPase